VFGLLRIIRGLVGFVGAGLIIGVLNSVLEFLTFGVAIVNVDIEIVKLVLGVLLLVAFLGMRAFINNLHLSKHQSPHPALGKAWAL
jgi:hypothetical protein